MKKRNYRSTENYKMSLFDEKINTFDTKMEQIEARIREGEGFSRDSSSAVLASVGGRT